MKPRVTLSVGLTQDFEHCENRKNFIAWLKSKIAPLLSPAIGYESAMAGSTLQHIHQIEALVAIERYATLDLIADDLRKELAATREDNVYEHNKGYQRAINLIMLKIESIDLETQAATSIAELQSAAILNIASEMEDPNDCRALHDYAKAIIDGCT